MIFAEIAARRPAREFHPQFDPAGDYRDLPGLDVQQPELRGETHAPVFGNEQQFAVGIEENSPHRAVGPVEVQGRAGRPVAGARGAEGQ